MSAGVFADWQPRYAACGISTFPVGDKKPAIRGYLRIGLNTSRELAEKYGDAAASGLALKPAKLVIVDVDTPDERILNDALDRHGQTPFVVRSGGGNFQAWYRSQGEGRSIRPDPDLPIDILGVGFVVAPPSMGARGRYRIIQGTLADLAQLPVMRDAPVSQTKPGPVAGPGNRNVTLWRHCMRQAHDCEDVDAVLDLARTFNADFAPPLPDVEVVKTAQSAWSYTERGDNRIGRGRRVVTTHDEIDGLLHEYPDAYLLLTILRRQHWGRDFVVANAMAELMPGGGWPEKRLARARRDLDANGKIELIRAAGKYRGPALYRFRVDEFDHQ